MIGYWTTAAATNRTDGWMTDSSGAATGTAVLGSTLSFTEPEKNPKTTVKGKTKKPWESRFDFGRKENSSWYGRHNGSLGSKRRTPL